jgi:mono/diheme cytochrome c family protein
VKNQGNKLMTFRAFSIGFSTALLALACGSDSNNPTDNGGDGENVTAPPVVRDNCDTNPEFRGCPGAQPDTTPVANNPGGSTPTPVKESDPLKLARAAAENVLRANCGMCHGSSLALDQASGRMNYIDNTDELVKQKKLIPLNSKGSLVIQRMEDGSMPPSFSNLPKVTQADIDTVIQYIDQPSFWQDTAVAANCDVVVDFDRLYEEVSNDLREADNDEDALNSRYIALTNRQSSGLCADDTSLDRDRQAIAKMVNALSTETVVHAPEPINKEQTIYRIDLRDYNWDRAINVVDGGTTLQGGAFTDVWEAIIANNPYAVPFVGNEADDAVADSGTTVPVMFANSMLDAATIGNLYYAIIDVDVNDTLGNFILNDLGVDVQQNLIDEEQLRAGTTKSRISKQDRVIERDDIKIRQGALWQSFDFLADDQNDSIFDDPFGFAAGGTEAIFTLPNGMLGYIIADDNDAIVEDSDILLDTQQNNNRAITSVSCSSCHASGLIPVIDEVHDVAIGNALLSQLNRDEIEQLDAVYLSPEEFAQQIDDDTQGFYQAALSKAKVPLSGVDPVSFSFLQFDGRVKLADAAGDLGLSAAKLDDQINFLDPAIGVLRSGSMDRDDFTAIYVDSLCRLSIVLENQPDAAVCQAAADALAAQ